MNERTEHELVLKAEVLLGLLAWLDPCLIVAPREIRHVNIRQNLDGTRDVVFRFRDRGHAHKQHNTKRRP